MLCCSALSGDSNARTWAGDCHNAQADAPKGAQQQFSGGRRRGPRGLPWIEAGDRLLGGGQANMPDPIPVIVLARLAVDRRAQADKLGAALLRDAVQRVVAVSENAGVRALLVHALNDRAKQFYEHYGFQASPVHPMTLMLRLQAVKSPD